MHSYSQMTGQALNRPGSPCNVDPGSSDPAQRRAYIMLTRQKLLVALTLFLFAAPASASVLAYVVNGQQFGSVDLGTGAFNPIGPGTPQGAAGLVPGPN